MNQNDKKVREVYNIDESLLIDLSFEERKGNFFEKSLTFYNQVKDRQVKSLSQKQQNWLWELECVLHDRAENKKSPNFENFQPQQKPQKKESFFDKILTKLTKWF